MSRKKSTNLSIRKVVEWLSDLVRFIKCRSSLNTDKLNADNIDIVYEDESQKIKLIIIEFERYRRRDRPWRHNEYSRAKYLAKKNTFMVNLANCSSLGLESFKQNLEDGLKAFEPLEKLGLLIIASGSFLFNSQNTSSNQGVITACIITMILAYWHYHTSAVRLRIAWIHKALTRQREFG